MQILVLRYESIRSTHPDTQEKMAVIRLNTSVYEEFFLWGILSSVGGHKICWEMNKALGSTFERIDDLVLERRPEADDAYFNFYAFDDKENFLRFELIKNKCNGEIYMKELKNFDYLIMVKGELDFFEEEQFLQRLKPIQCVQAILTIDLNKLKNQEQLILE